MDRYVELLWADYVQALRDNVSLRTALEDAQRQITLLHQQVLELKPTDTAGKGKRSA